MGRIVGKHVDGMTGAVCAEGARGEQYLCERCVECMMGAVCVWSV